MAKKPEIAAEPEQENLPLVEIEGEKAPNGAAPAETVVKAGPTLEDTVSALQKQLEDEKNARLASEQRAQQAESRAQQSDGGAHASNIALLDGTIGRLKADMDTLEGQLVTASSAGDHTAVAKINRMMAEVATKLDRVEVGKVQYEQQIQQSRAAPAAPQRPVPAQDRPDVLARSMEATHPTSARWLRQNADRFRTDATFAKLINAHNIALSEHEEGSEAYLQRIEGIIGMSGAAPAPVERNDGIEVSANPLSGASSAAGGRSTAPPAAPPTRNGNGGGTNRNRVKLTPEQVEAANMLGQTLEEYAQGLIDPKTQAQLKRPMH